MEKSLYIDLITHFGATAPQTALTNLLEQARIPMADCYAFRDAKDNQALLQEFDSFFSYISILDALFQSDKNQLSLRIQRGDIHGFYLLDAETSITLIHSHTQTNFPLDVGRGCYFYLPPGDYRLELPSGYLKLFSLCFRAKIFRRGNERQYQFLHALIEAYRQQKDEVVQSLDFRLSSGIRLLIERLFAGLKSGSLESELYIQAQTLELLRLSKDAVFEEYEKILSNQFLAQQVNEAIRLGIRQEGLDFRLEVLPRLFDRSLQYLGRIHRETFGQSLTQCRSGALLEMAQETLETAASITTAAYICGFSDLHQFRRFFKKASGITPTEYLQHRRQE